VFAVLCFQIVDLTKQGHFQLACGRLFELKHNTDFKFAPQHPNQYFEESQKLLGGDTGIVL
jgi:DNA primase large subunit